MTNDKFSMPNSQFRVSALVAAPPRSDFESLKCNSRELRMLGGISLALRFLRFLLFKINPCNPCNPWFNSFGCGLPRCAVELNSVV
jgi:hypothetical protein